MERSAREQTGSEEDLEPLANPNPTLTLALTLTLVRRVETVAVN